MDPVTHFLTGACLGRAGSNRLTAYATLTMVLAAEAPDIDIVWNLRGPVAGFEHHRGITHTFLGAPLMAFLVLGVVWLWHCWQVRRRERSSAGARNSVQDTVPIRWGILWLLALLADFSHILLDWTNNYGVRPFFPFNPHWYAGSIFFVVEPVLLGILLLALILPAILGLADQEIGVRRQRFRGRGWAIFALCAAVVLGCWRWAEHERALHLLAQENYQNEPVVKMAVSPYPGDVFRWFGVVETKDFYKTAFLNTRKDRFTSDQDDLYYRQPQTPAMLVAKQSWLGRVYLDWSAFPFVKEVGTSGPLPGEDRSIRVQFQDLRFAYRVLPTRSSNRMALGGVVTIGPDGKVETMRMGGRTQK